MVRKQRFSAEQFVTQSEKNDFLEKLLDTSPNCVYVKDEQGRYLLANKTIANLYQTTPEEMIGKTDVDFADQARLKPVEADYFIDVDKKAIETGETQVVPREPFTWNDGTIHYFFTTKTPISFQGNPHCVMGISVDITAAVKSQEAQVQCEKKYQNYINNAPDGVFITDENGQYLEVNEAASNITGYSEDELLSMSILDITADGHEDEAMAGFQALIEKGFFSGELCYIHKNGQHRWWRVDAVKLANNQLMGFVHDITTKKMMEDELRDSERRLKNAEKTARIGHVEWNCVQQKAHWSDVIYDLFELDSSLGEPSYNEIMKLYFPDDAKYLEDAVDRAIHHGESYSLDLKLLLPSGSIAFHHVIGKPCLDDRGRVEKIIGTVQDVTERKKAEIKLHTNERKFRTIIEHAYDGIALLDSTGIIIDVNKRAADIFGGRKPDLIGKNFSHLSIISENELSKVEAQFKSFLNDKNTVTDIWLTNKKGERLCIEGTGSVFENEDHEKRIVVIVRDKTEKKNAEQELKENEERFRNLAELLPAAVIETDSNLMITFANNQAYELMKYKKRNYKQGLHALDMFPPEERKRAQKNLKRRISGEHIGSVEYVAVKKNGKRFPVLVHAAPMMKGGRFQGLRAVIVDITKLNEYRTKLKSLNNQLEEKVSERTEKIQQLLKQKDEFINQMGHDLKNPLGPFIQLLPILKKHVTTEKDKEMIEVLDRNAKYMKNLVNKTIELAKLNSSKITFNFEHVNLSDLVEEVVNVNSIMFDEQEISIDNKISDNVMVQIDKLRIQEVFSNLFNNAVKYTKGPGKISIDAEPQDGKIVVSVKDSGIGLSDEQMDRLFNEYYKADTSRHDFESSGLGLPICKRIIEKHDGTIWAESDGIGKGSSFYFSLPRVNNKGN